MFEVSCRIQKKKKIQMMSESVCVTKQDTTYGKEFKNCTWHTMYEYSRIDA